MFSRFNTCIALTAVLTTPALAQSATEVDCSFGVTHIKSDNSQVVVAKDCMDLNVSGNGNTNTVENVGVLGLQGSDNTVSARFRRKLKQWRQEPWCRFPDLVSQRIEQLSGRF